MFHMGYSKLLPIADKTYSAYSDRKARKTQLKH